MNSTCMLKNSFRMLVRSVSIPFCAVGWGYHPLSYLRAFDPDFAVASAEEFGVLLGKAAPESGTFEVEERIYGENAAEELRRPASRHGGQAESRPYMGATK